MKTFDELVIQQDDNAVNLQKAIQNYKKTPKDRKTLEYVERKAIEIDELWTVFQRVDNTIRRDPQATDDHPYFVKNIHASMGEKYNEVREDIEVTIQMFRQKAVEQQKATIQQNPANDASSSATDHSVNLKANPCQPTQLTQLHNLILKQTKIIGIVQRMLSEVLSDSTQHSVSYYATKVKIVEHHWHTVQAWHDQILDLLDDIDSGKYDIEAYLQLELQINDSILEIKERGEQSPSSTTNPAHQHLPKVTLPKFDGDYLKWRQFFDLFNEMIHKTQIPSIQKMWYLKTNMTGEAEKLIRHLSLTEDNYSTAWTILQNRYNNMRLLTSALLEKIIGQGKHSTDNPSVAALKGLHDITQESLMALGNLGIDTTSWDPMLIHILIKKLDKNTHILYEQSLKDPRELPSLAHFLKFLEMRFQSLEAVGQKDRPASSKAVTSVVTSDQRSKKCSSCNDKMHPLFTCPKFLQLAVTKRLQFLKTHQLCINCLKPGHFVKDCASRKCTKCEKKHNTLVHFDNSSSHTQDTDNHNTSGNAAQQSTTLAASKQSIEGGYVLLSTALVKLIANNGKAIECRAILDSGSQVNLMTERAAKQLGLSLRPASLILEGIGNGKKDVRSRVNVNLQSRIHKYSNRLEAFILPQIISQQPTQHVNTSNWAIPKNITLADPQFNRPGRIDLLIGAEFYHQLLTNEKIELRNGLPTLQNTVFGWILAGKIVGSTSNGTACGILTKDDDELNSKIEKFWQLEEVHLDKKVLTTAEQNCESHFLLNTRRNKDGRFVVKLPFAESTSALGDSKQISINRFYSLERRLAKDLNLKTQYAAFMEEYEALGHMTCINKNSVSSPCYFIPHHCVTRPDSTTTKLRVVFDASSKTSSGVALNDLTYTGPSIQSDLFSILLRFRCPRFVFTSDIQKMYRQILVDVEDRRYQLIVWRRDATEELRYYQLNTVTYGTRSAPYLATKCLQQLGKEYSSQYPLGAKSVLNDFYVDDCLSGSDSLSTAVEIQQQLSMILQKGGFVLRKWCANHPKLLQSIPAVDQEVNLDFNNDINNAIKTLGLIWLPKTDNFCIKVNLADSTRVTKRTIVSDVARIFDPLGLLAPVVVTAKTLIQQLWQIKLDWDDELPAELYTKWAKFRASLNELNNTQVSRHVFQQGKRSSLQLHSFADASEKAYGAAVYVRSVCENGTTIVRLLCARSRVAPLKAQTIPRLELCAALLSAQLLARVREDLKLKEAPAYCWTDSEIVLAWINSQSTSFQTFVANRIARIQELTSATQWRHVRSKDNPADVLSRGLLPSELKTCNLWFYGPFFLHGKMECWPEAYSTLHAIETSLEKRQKVVSSNVAIMNEPRDWIYTINNRNSFKSLVHIVAYVLRFTEHAKKQTEDRAAQIALTPCEQKKALTVIIRGMQEPEFENEINALKTQNNVNKTSQLSGLNPFLDDEGIIRVGGRLESAAITYDAKHPVIIPYNDPLSKLLLRWFHEEHLHCGPQTLLAHLRQRFWPIKGKSMTRSIVQSCIRCTKARPKLFHQMMGGLPANRVQPARPFINSGVDFCGPFWIHFKIRGKRPHKAYVAVFCCFSTKAVHLEIVSDLSTEAFIGCLKRFISRRGRCQNLYCDNATNFVGAKNQLVDLKEAIHTERAQQTIMRTCSDKGIAFHFIPPRAPHFGGLWEAAVKSAKHLFTRSVSTASLTYEELETIMVEIEAILNSRPLTPMSANTNDFSALTPGHFLIGEPLTAPIDTTAAPNKASLLTRWKLVSYLKHEFWNRWSREYLNELQYRHKWKEQVDNVEPGMMVIIKEDNLPPLQWPLGRIVKTYKGIDSAVRVADIQTANGIRRRPIHRLAPLPLKEHDTNEEISTSTQLNLDVTSPEEIQPDNDGSVARKRRKTSSNAILTTIISTLLILPVVLCSSIHIEKFDPTAGIHFEHIGSTNIVMSEWNIITYYDLQPLLTELQSLVNGTKVLHHLCQQLQQKTFCEDLVLQFQHTESELRLENSLLTPHRQKRGAFNVIGNVANSLFGVLDSDYAEKMSGTISAVQSNEEHLLQLLKNQTSIIDSTINIIKRDQSTALKAFTKLENKLSEVTNRIRTNEQSRNEEKLFQLFISLGLQLTITASNIQRIQSSIINVLINVHHGQISPLLLSPQQLKIEFDKILAHLPPTMQIPGYHENLLYFYKLMVVKGGITTKHAVFKITIPLKGPDQFELYRLIPIPTLLNKTVVAIKPSAQILAITLHRDKYFPTSTEILQSCSIVGDQKYLCPNTQPIFNKGAATCLCEVSLFNNDTKPHCDFKRMDDQVWIQTNHKNQWIFALAKPIQITAVCGTEVSQFSLDGSGFIHVGQNCIIKHESLTLFGNHILSSVSRGSYTSFGSISELAKPNKSDSTVTNNIDEQYSTQLQELTALQVAISAQKIMDLPNKLQSSSQHSFAVGYSALILVAFLIIFLIAKHKALPRIRKASQAPVPAPRTRTGDPEADSVFETTFARN